MPVDLRKLASCETTTCSSLVRWQSNSSMSVPRSTALREPTNRRHVVLYHCSTKGQWGHDKGRQQWWNKMQHIHVTENHRAVKRWISCSMSAEVGCGHKLITTELRWHTLTTITCTGTSYVSHRRSAVRDRLLSHWLKVLLTAWKLPWCFPGFHLLLQRHKANNISNMQSFHYICVTVATLPLLLEKAQMQHL